MAAAQASRYDSPSAGSSKAGTTTTKTSPSTSTASGAQQTYENIVKQNMTPESLAALEALIKTLSTGGTPQQQAEIAKKRQTQQLIEGLLGQFSSGQAFSDAQNLMALNLQQAMERNMPSIQRSIEGAGTSASSAQGLMAQNLSRDAALAAGAMGAEQARAYGGITSNLTGQLAGLAKDAMDPTTATLINALSIAKGATETTSGSRSTSTSEQTLNSGSTQTSTFAPEGSSEVAGSGSSISSAGADAGTGGLDPLRYYSQYGVSGGGQSLYDYLRSM